MSKFNIGNFLSKFFVIFKLGGRMSEKGADAAGKEIALGVKVFFFCLGIALILLCSPGVLTAIRWW